MDYCSDDNLFLKHLIDDAITERQQLSDVVIIELRNDASGTRKVLKRLGLINKCS